MKKFTFTFVILLTGLTGLYSQGFKLQFQDWPYQCSFKSDSGKIFINHIKDYKRATNCSWLNYRRYEDYTIIGIQGGVGGCKLPDVDFNIYQNDEKKEYVIEAIVISYGACRRNNPYKRVVYVNKFKDNYHVIFKKLRDAR